MLLYLNLTLAGLLIKENNTDIQIRRSAYVVTVSMKNN